MSEEYGMGRIRPREERTKSVAPDSNHFTQKEQRIETERMKLQYLVVPSQVLVDSCRTFFALDDHYETDCCAPRCASS